MSIITAHHGHRMTSRLSTRSRADMRSSANMRPEACRGFHIMHEMGDKKEMPAGSLTKGETLSVLCREQREF